jgi:hypothetical protein
MFNSNAFPEISQQEMERQIARERANTATIGGDRDSVIRAVERLFPELGRLRSQMLGRGPRAEWRTDLRMEPGPRERQLVRSAHLG